MAHAHAVQGRRHARQARAPRKPGHPPTEWYLNPTLHLALNCLLMTAAELMLTVGAKAATQSSVPAWLGWTGLRTFVSVWTLAGVAIYIVAFANWLYVLRWMPLSVAYPMTSAVQVLIALGAWIFLHEHLSLLRWAGIGLISLGIVVSSRPAAQAEEEL